LPVTGCVSSKYVDDAGVFIVYNFWFLSEFVLPLPVVKIVGAVILSNKFVTEKYLTYRTFYVRLIVLGQRLSGFGQ
jgi:hypothetical protein